MNTNVDMQKVALLASVKAMRLPQRRLHKPSAPRCVPNKLKPPTVWVIVSVASIGYAVAAVGIQRTAHGDIAKPRAGKVRRGVFGWPRTTIKRP